VEALNWFLHGFQWADNLRGCK